ncbi:MAG TPA: hypothetical protein VIS06_00530 [Mycobacteriales bacterium]
MSSQQVRVRLNQQQLELLDRTIERFPGSGRDDLILTALHEYCAAHPDLPGTAAQGTAAQGTAAR